MSEKTEEPSQKKLDDARKKGEIPKSQKVTVSAALASGLIGLTVAVTIAKLPTVEVFENLILKAGTPAYSSDQAMFDVLNVMALATGPVLLLVILGVLLGTFAQTRGLITFESMMPKWETLSGLSFFKKFGTSRPVLDALQMIAYSIAYGLLAFYLVRKVFYLWAAQTALESNFVLASGFGLVKQALAYFVIFGLVLAILDFAYQYFQFMKGQKMSKDEVTREYKEQEGDPMIKGMRRQIAREIANSPMKKAVSRASMIVTNPTHVAIAILANSDYPVPIVLYKAIDDHALRVRAVAKEMGIPIFEQVPLARRLLNAGSIDTKVPRDTYRDIAKLLVKCSPQAAKTNRETH